MHPKGGAMYEKARFWKDLKSGRFASMVRESSKGRQLSNSHEAYNILKPLFAKDTDIEQAYFIFLNAKNKIISIEKLFSGTLTTSCIYPREVVKRLLILGAGAFILGHNHPSGDTSPSQEDHAITKRICIAASVIEASFHNHLIIGNGYFSMADAGYLKEISSRVSDFLRIDQGFNEKSYANTDALQEALNLYAPGSL
jgi:DNA repair protein RadC